MASELEQLRQEAEQLKNQIRVRNTCRTFYIDNSFLMEHLNSFIIDSPMQAECSVLQAA